MIENEDYELTPSPDDDSWRIRIKSGPFTETVYQYSIVTVAEDGESLNYSVDMVYSPDPDLDESNEEFQETTGQILLSLIERSLEMQGKDEL